MMQLQFGLSEETMKTLLNLTDWKVQVMTALEKLNQEAQETKAAVAAVGVAVAGLKAKYDEAVAALVAAVTPEQVDAAKVAFDEAQAAAQAIVDSLAAPVPPAEPPTEPTEPAPPSPDAPAPVA